MSVELKIDVTGIPEILGNLRRKQARLGVALNRTVIGTVQDIRDGAKRDVPVDTGALQRSIRIRRFPAPRGGSKWGVLFGGKERNPKTRRTVDYAAHVEFGTSRMRARPYARPNIQKALKDLPGRMRREIREMR